MPTNTNGNTNSKTDWKKNELGVLWKRESKAGENYLTGTLKLAEATKAGQEIQVIIFSNKGKKSDNHPDFRVYISEKTGSNAPITLPVKAQVKTTVVEQPQDNSAGSELL